MGKQRSKKEQPNRFLGIYTLAGGRRAVGELRLKGSSTLLKLHSDQEMAPVEWGTCVEGVAYTGERLTLIDCHSPGVGHTSFKDEPINYHADVFPHYVAVGRCHLKPNRHDVCSIHFTTTDLAALFYDFDAFSHVINPEPIIDQVLQERRQNRPVERGERPQVFYFTGKDCIAEVSTAIGKVSVHHRPRYNMGGPSGVFIKNRIVVSIEPVHPVSFIEAIDHMYEIGGFLSMAAGRTQGIDHIHINITEEIDGRRQSLTVYPSYGWKVSDKGEQHKPHPGDVPLDPIRHRAEFDQVLTEWLGRHSGWRVARTRYLECLRKANKYGAERLVAAANMFDILPPEAVPLATELSEDLAATREACKAMFRKLPVGIDRNSALDALGRLGKPSLPKKIAYRTSIVESKLGRTFPDLQFVASVAVKCRNFFVHGSSADIDYQKVEPLLSFLTDALEFIFAASDFIEAGWDASRWNSNPYSWGHSFTRFRSEYEMALAELRRVTNTERSDP
ncbi:HEPN domain-containing protein [Burkholderia pseudomultivorans]|uniref:ApeA N-terminal domain 1-containing protein n=1 Tax=Burkholderia pseudomultivorans TaxID=1207504 RepID=UPI000A6D4592|nr:HEPN domain-containing protein [Burkholderia pseudomultivorans]